VGQSGLPGYVMMETSVDVLNLSLGVTLGEAVLSLDEARLDSEINRIAHTLFSDGAVTYERGMLHLVCPGRDFVFLFRRKLIICSPLNRVFIPRRIWKNECVGSVDGALVC
jgi:hypothetical protein